MEKLNQQRILERDIYCRLCGGGDSLQVHHITYRSQGGKDTLDNLILLCLYCHQKVHSNKKLYQPMLLEKVRKDENIRQNDIIY
jgi:5-methylcytosine-specific restriction endonuclease McrA